LLAVYTADRPEVHEVIRAMRGTSDEFPDRVLIGEIYLPIDRLVAYYGAQLDEAQLPFNFQLLLLPQWSADAVASVIRRYEAALPAGAWPNWVLGNHDRSRIASRVGPAQARVAAMLLLTLRGTPTIYMGDELGMVDTPIPPQSVRDPSELRQPGMGFGRDPVRTPFPWTDEPGAGFTSGTPWLPVGSDMSLSRQYGDPGSMVSLHRQLLALRRARPALSEGAVAAVNASGTVLGYERRLDDDRLAVALNLAHADAECDVVPGMVVAATHRSRLGAKVGGTLLLQADEGVVIDPGSGRG
jgi:alpha-glucosidase